MTNEFSCPDNPTWNNAVKGFFNQTDIQHMKPIGIDLSSYESVKQNAQAIYDKTSTGQMPPPPAQPWSKDKVACFQKWMQAGSPEG